MKHLPLVHSLSITRLLFLLCILAMNNATAFADDCNGNQATNEKSVPGGQNLYVQLGQPFHVNLNGLSGVNATQIADIKTGISSWAGTSGITIVFDSSPPGFGVVTVSSSSSIGSTGYTNFAYGGSAASAANQITGGTIQLNLN